MNLDTRCEECGRDDIPRLPYCALSYACGDPSITRPVLVNGYARNVTSNLRAFLEQAAMDLESSRNSTRALDPFTETYWVDFVPTRGKGSASKHNAMAIYWIDSLCINQCDDVENSH
jgi:hypothetical protein